VVLIADFRDWLSSENLPPSALQFFSHLMMMQYFEANLGYFGKFEIFALFNRIKFEYALLLNINVH